MNSSDDSGEVEYGSISGWLHDFQRGDKSALDKIWERYFNSLVRFAQRRAGTGLGGLQDEEDFAIVAFSEFVRGVEAGQFKQLQDRSDLWQVLTMIASRRVKNAHRDSKVRGKRNVELSSFMNDPARLDAFLEAPSAEVFDIMNEDCKEMLEGLAIREKNIAMQKLMGFTNVEIAEKQAISVATVERSLKKIREAWMGHEGS